MTSMNLSTEHVPLGTVGQRLRAHGLALNIRRLRHAIACGTVPAERIGGRWAVSAAEARKFAVPLEKIEP